MQATIIERNSPEWLALATTILPDSCVDLKLDIQGVLNDVNYKPHINWAITVTENNTLIGLALISTHHMYNIPRPTEKFKVIPTTENVAMLEYICGIRGGGRVCLEILDKWLYEHFDGEQHVIQTCSVFEACSYYKNRGFTFGIHPRAPLIQPDIPGFRINDRIRTALYVNGSRDPGLTVGDRQNLTEVVEFIQSMNRTGLSLGLSLNSAVGTAANTVPTGGVGRRTNWFKSMNEGYGMVLFKWGN